MIDEKRDDAVSFGMNDILVIVSLSLLSIVFQGHNFGLGNHTLYLGWIMRFADPNLFGNDWFLHTAVYHPNVIYPLFWLSKIVSLDLSFLIAHVATRILLCGGVYLLALYAFENRLTACLAIVMTILFPRISIGRQFAQGSHFEANFLGFSLAIMAIAMLVRSQRYPRTLYIAAGLIGIAINAHFFIGVHTAAIFTIYLFARRREFTRRQLVLSYLTIVLLSSFTLWNVSYSFFTQQQTLTSSQLTEILAFRLAHHYSPFTWAWRNWLIFGYYFFLWLVLRRRSHGVSKFVENIIIVYVIVTCVIHTFFVEIVPISVIEYFSGFRQTVLFTIFMGIYVAHFVSCLAGANRLRVIAAVILICTFRVPLLFIPASFVILILFRNGRETCREISPSAWSRTPIHIVFAVGCGLLFVMASFGCLDQFFLKIRSKPHFRREVTVDNPELLETLKWIKVNTPQDAVFIIPPGMESFRVISERACVVDFKGSPFINHECREWFERIVRIGKILGDGETIEVWADDYATVALERLHGIRLKHPSGLEFLDAGFRELTSDELSKLARMFNATHLFTSARKEHPFRTLHNNSQYAVYQFEIP